MADIYQFPELPGGYAGKHPVAAATIIIQGGLVAIDASGNAVKAAAAVTGFVGGKAVEGVDNSAGAAGDLSVLLQRGVYVLQLDATNPPTKAHVGKTVFAITPDTVAHTGTCRAGRLVGFDGDGRAIVDTNQARLGATVALTSTDGTAAAASASLANLAAEAEKIGDDVRALHAALKTQGVIN
jgi:hypothetical protein